MHSKKNISTTLRFWTNAYLAYRRSIPKRTWMMHRLPHQKRLDRGSRSMWIHIWHKLKVINGPLYLKAIKYNNIHPRRQPKHKINMETKRIERRYWYISKILKSQKISQIINFFSKYMKLATPSLPLAVDNEFCQQNFSQQTN